MHEVPGVPRWSDGPVVPVLPRPFDAFSTGPARSRPALPVTAVLHDYVTQRGGAERVALLLAQSFGGGALTTSAYLPQESHDGFRDLQVTELLPHVSERAKRSRAALAPLAAAAFARHRVQSDVVLCSSSGWSHWTPTSSPSVVYCYTPPRWFWAPDDYFAGMPAGAIGAATAVGRATRWVDRRKALAPSSSAPRSYLAISTCVRDRIRASYGVDAQVVFPPTTFDATGEQEPVPGLEPGFVLTIARERGYKNIAAAQEVFQTGAFGRLVVVGSRRSGPRGHVLDLGRVSEAQLRWLYASCRAVLALSHEDFGLTPVEGHLFGKPTVALRAGGYLDTCVEDVNAVFAESLEPQEITTALHRLDASSFDPTMVADTAERFSVRTFEREIGQALTEAAGAEPAALPVPLPRSSTETAPVRIHMTGSEWFAARAGGLNRYFENLHQALREHPGADVTGAAFGPPAPGGESWGELGGSMVRRVRAARTGPALRRGDVLDRHFSPYGQPKGDASLVVHFHGPWAAESRMTGASSVTSRAKLAVERARLREADRVVVLSRCFADLVEVDYGVPAERIVVIPPGVDLQRFAFEPEIPTTPSVVCVRRLERRMGIDVLLRAWPGVLSASPDAQLTIIGRGTEESRLRELAHDLDIANSVRFETSADDEQVLRSYRDATVTVVPTVALEGFGLIALESLAVGRAPVVTDCGGLPDSVTGLDPTLVVPAGDVEALGQRLVRALRGDRPSPEACREHAERFSWAAVADAHVELYRGLSR